MTAGGTRLDVFWRLAEPLLAAGQAERSTMMGFPCLRVGGAFFASLEPATGHLIAKLSADRVHQLIAGGGGMAFAPNGRRFREWVAVPYTEEAFWRCLLDEARVFVQLSQNGRARPPR